LQERRVAPNLARDGFPHATAYTIQPGDTLFSIAQRFNTTVPAIVALNHLADPSLIQSGWVIFIPDPIILGPSIRLDHGSRQSNLVALTFDMGGRVEPALEIVHWLIDNQVPAAIFMTGAMADNPNTDAGREVLRLIDANPGLLGLGNHAYSHTDFRDLTNDQMVSELLTTETSILPHTSVSPRPFFRPPFGGVDARVLNTVGPAGYGYTVMWDVDTIDWLPVADGGPTANQIVQKVVNNAKGGSIVLMHLGGYNTFQALPAIVAGLQARGLAPATIGQLIAQ
jgi:peptidoglycan/xylan/chitin deacetylase (PgdA/CDA1 family)